MIIGKQEDSEDLHEVLHKRAELRTLEMATSSKPREHRPPCKIVTHLYLSSYPPRPLPGLSAHASTADMYLVLACKAVQAKEYVRALSLVRDSLADPPGTWPRIVHAPEPSGGTGLTWLVQVRSSLSSRHQCSRISIAADF